MALDIKWTRISPDLSIENQICRPLYIEFYKEELMSAMAAYKWYFVCLWRKKWLPKTDLYYLQKRSTSKTEKPIIWFGLLLSIGMSGIRSETESYF